MLFTSESLLFFNVFLMLKSGDLVYYSKSVSPRRYKQTCLHFSWSIMWFLCLVCLKSYCFFFPAPPCITCSYKFAAGYHSVHLALLLFMFFLLCECLCFIAHFPNTLAPFIKTFDMFRTILCVSLVSKFSFNVLCSYTHP